MKTTPFLIRVAICCLLAMIPLTDIENRIYSARMELRGVTAQPGSVVIFDVDPSLLYNPPSYQALQARLREKHPAAIVVSPSPTQSGRHGMSGFLFDPDGEIRRATIQPDGREPSLTYFVLGQLRPDTTDSADLLPHFINYAGPAGTFARTRLSRAMDIPVALEGKTVILTDETDEAPLFKTPHGLMSFVEVLANDIRTVVGGRHIHYASWPEIALIVTLIVVLGAFAIISFPVLLSALVLSGSAVVLTIVVFQVVFQFTSVYLPASNVWAALFITYLVFTGYRLAFQDSLQWRLRELDQMKTNFLSLMSHDLKTPIAKIQAAAERMRREGAFRPELVDSIENSGNELKHSITSILTLSKIESQKVVLNKRSNDINQLILQALKRLQPLASQKGLEIQESLEPLFSVECDEDLMRQVLTNLIDNAVKYSPAGSRVIVRSREEQGYVHVEVEDFGPGIPKDQLPLMFRKFSRLLGKNTEIKGTGLGLYLSKYFIELHGGTIGLKTVENQGSVFTIKLPLSEL
jgi:signal transduction histidine kinase